MTTRGRPDALAVVGAWVQSWYWMLLLWLVFAAIPLLFPDGRLPSRGWRWPAAVGVIGAAGTVVLGMLTDTLTGQDVDYRIDNPIGIDGTAGRRAAPRVPGPQRAARGRRADRRRRRRRPVPPLARCRAAADEVVPLRVAPLVLLPLLDLLPEIVGGVMLAWVVLTLPVAIAVAVLRYRLDGIDVVINRTLVYVRADRRGGRSSTS